MYLQVVGRSRYKHVIWIYWIQLYLFFHFHEHGKTEKNINIVVLNACLCLQDMLTLVCCFWLTFFVWPWTCISPVHWNVDMTVQGVGKLCLMLKIERIWHYFNVQHPYVFWYTTYFGNIFPKQHFYTKSN